MFVYVCLCILCASASLHGCVVRQLFRRMCVCVCRVCVVCPLLGPRKDDSFLKSVFKCVATEVFSVFAQNTATTAASESQHETDTHTHTRHKIACFSSGGRWWWWPLLCKCVRLALRVCLVSSTYKLGRTAAAAAYYRVCLICFNFTFIACSQLVLRKRV